MTKLEQLLDMVLQTWPGTVEELGAVLYDATRHPWGLTVEATRADSEIIAIARRRLLECQGGKELWKYELLDRTELAGTISRMAGKRAEASLRGNVVECEFCGECYCVCEREEPGDSLLRELECGHEQPPKAD